MPALHVTFVTQRVAECPICRSELHGAVTTIWANVALCVSCFDVTPLPQLNALAASARRKDEPSRWSVSHGVRFFTPARWEPSNLAAFLMPPPSPSPPIEPPPTTAIPSDPHRGHDHDPPTPTNHD